LPAAVDRDYTRFLNRDRLRARISIHARSTYERITPPGLQEARGELNAEQAKAMTEPSRLKERGAVIVDPADIPSVVDRMPAGISYFRGLEHRWAEGLVLLRVVFTVGSAISTKGSQPGPIAPVKSLTELRH
jgi:hypothetical protein